MIFKNINLKNNHSFNSHEGKSFIRKALERVKINFRLNHRLTARNNFQAALTRKYCFANSIGGKTIFNFAGSAKGEREKQMAENVKNKNYKRPSEHGIRKHNKGPIENRDPSCSVMDWQCNFEEFIAASIWVF